MKNKHLNTTIEEETIKTQYGGEWLEWSITDLAISIIVLIIVDVIANN